MKTVPEQLTDIYYKHEHWHVFKLPYYRAIRYHAKRLKTGEILVYLDKGEVLGYCERHFVYNACFFDNAWIKKEYGSCSKIFWELNKQFWATMPKYITHIFGEQGSVLRKVKISNWRKNNGIN